MTVTTEINEYSIYNELWSGGHDTLQDLTVDEVAEILAILDDCNNGCQMSLTELNDFFWFERDTIAEWLGFNDYEEIMER